MRTCSMVVLFLAFLTTSPTWAGKITVDPNTLDPPAPKITTDKRLEQNITYHGGSKRLHDVADELSALTGVKVRAGSGTDDWQVRDIPVVVWAKDVALGKLLRAIADTTHLALTSQKSEDGVISYRIWRDKARALELEDYLKKKHEWGDKMARWEWDAVASLKDVPESVLTPKNDPMAVSFSDNPLIAASPLLAALGPEVRDRVLAGEEVRISVKDAPPNVAPLIENYLRTVAASAHKDFLGAGINPQAPSDDDFSNAALVLDTPHVMGSDRPSIALRGKGPSPVNTAFLGNVNVLAAIAKDYVSKEPEQPKPPRSILPNQQAEIWRTTVTLEKPKDKDPVTFDDACVAIAEATDFAVVAEDFHSHQKYNTAPQAFDGFKNGAALSCIHGFEYRAKWAVDEKSRILTCSETYWPSAHQALAPEWIIEGLKRKLDGSGAEFEDVVQLASLTDLQLSEWVCESRYLSTVRWPFAGPDKPLWALYANLTDKQKKQAKSAQGLELGGGDLTALADMLREREPKLRQSGMLETKIKWWENAPESESAGSLVVRLKSTESVTPNNWKQRSYILEFAGKRGSEPFTLSLPFPEPFPKYSEKRMAELVKGQRGAAP